MKPPKLPGYGYDTAGMSRAEVAAELRKVAPYNALCDWNAAVREYRETGGHGSSNAEYAAFYGSSAGPVYLWRINADCLWRIKAASPAETAYGGAL